MLRLAATLERGSEHPLAAAIVAAAQERGLTLGNAADFDSPVGRGVVGTVEGKRLALGDRRLLSDLGIEDVSSSCLTWRRRAVIPRERLGVVESFEACYNRRAYGGAPVRAKGRSTGSRMLFVHAADIHLDSPLRNLVLAESQQIERVRRATRDAFQALIDLCIARQACLLILAGDLWDGDAPNMQTALFFRTQIARLDKAGIRVVIKKGNHDAANRITAALDLPTNARIFDHRKPETFVFDDLGFAVHGQSFAPGPVNDNLAARYPAPIAGLLNIGVLHTSLAGGTYHDPYAPCSLDDLTTKGYAYWALGHIHKGVTHCVNPWVVYPGNLQGRDVREAGPKGCVVVDTEDNRVTGIDRIAVDVVRWHEARFNLSAMKKTSDLVAAFRDELAGVHRNADGRPSAVRVVLEGKSSIATDLRRRPDWLRQTVLETAAEVSDDLWLEELHNNNLDLDTSTVQPAGLDLDLEQALAGVAAEASVVADTLRQELASLRSKLPDALKSHPAIAMADDESTLRASLQRLAPKLAARLAGDPN